MKKLFLDDLRTIDMVYDKSMEPEFDIVRTYDAFVKYIKKNGLPDFISFDNDLGLDNKGQVALDGYAAAKWLVYESNLDLTNLEFNVHSANPVAARQIRGLLTNYQRHLKEKKRWPTTSYQMNKESTYLRIIYLTITLLIIAMVVSTTVIDWGQNSNDKIATESIPGEKHQLDQYALLTDETWWNDSLMISLDFFSDSTGFLVEGIENRTTFSYGLKNERITIVTDESDFRKFNWKIETLNNDLLVLTDGSEKIELGH